MRKIQKSIFYSEILYLGILSIDYYVVKISNEKNDNKVGRLSPKNCSI